MYQKDASLYPSQIKLTYFGSPPRRCNHRLHFAFHLERSHYQSILDIFLHRFLNQLEHIDSNKLITGENFSNDFLVFRPQLAVFQGPIALLVSGYTHCPKRLAPPLLSSGRRLAFSWQDPPWCPALAERVSEQVNACKSKADLGITNSLP